jgi:Protein of unknown function (DUF2281)
MLDRSEIQPMTVRETAITKLHQLPDALVQEAIDFIDFLTQKHQTQKIDEESRRTVAEAWSQWFEAADTLTVNSPEQTKDYQQLLLDKYRQQGLEL